METARNTAVPQRRRLSLITGSACHFLHDGLVQILYVLLPIWQIAFDLSLTQVGLLITLYLGAMASFQMPAGILAERFGERVLLVGGTVVTALGFITLGMTDGFVALLSILTFAGLSSGVQHPLASSLIARAYEEGGRRVAIGTFNFAGDIGKVAFPALAALILANWDWPWVTTGFGGFGLVAALGIFLALRTLGASATETGKRTRQAKAKVKDWGILDKRGFSLLSLLAMVDTTTRFGFLTFIPFLMIGKGMAVETTGLALGLLFAGGALGKFLCGVIAEKVGIIAAVVLTEAVTGGGILLTLVLPLEAIFVFLPVLGVAMNGTSSVLYGTVADFVTSERQARAFGFFYTLVMASAAVAPSLYGIVSDLTSVAATMGIIGVVVLTTIPLAWLLRASVRRSIQATS